MWNSEEKAEGANKSFIFDSVVEYSCLTGDKSRSRTQKQPAGNNSNVHTVLTIRYFLLRMSTVLWLPVLRSIRGLIG